LALFEDVFAPYVPFGGRPMQLAKPYMRGTDVAVLQAIYNLMLATMHPPHGPLGRLIAITGAYDEATASAVRSVQSYFDLTVDGVVGVQTFVAFGQGVGAEVSYGGPAYGSRQLRVGSSGGDVTVLQNRLNVFRYGADIGRPANGYFSVMTSAAASELKADATSYGNGGFAATSIAGIGYYDASWLYTLAGGRDIFTGRHGFDVAMVQLLLRHPGFYQGPIHGYFDAPTQAAVRSLQGVSGITVDGVVGRQTFHAIGQRNQNAAPVPAGLAWPVYVPLAPVGGSVATGRAVLYFHGPALVVDVSAIGLTPGEAYDACILFGTCASGGQVAYRAATLVSDATGSAQVRAEIGGILLIPTTGWNVAVAMPPAQRGAGPTILSCGSVSPPFPVLSPAAATSSSGVETQVLPLDGSAASGSAILRFIAPQTLHVTVTMAGLAPGSTHQSHIGYGACQGSSPGPIAYALTDLVADSRGVAAGNTVLTGVTAIPPAGWHVRVDRDSAALDGAAALACGDVRTPEPVLPGVGI